MQSCNPRISWGAGALQWRPLPYILLHHGALHVDHEPVVHIIVNEALVGRVDVIGIDLLDLRNNVVLSTEVLQRSICPA